jgi:hypothetical protein
MISIINFEAVVLKISLPGTLILNCRRAKSSLPLATDKIRGKAGVRRKFTGDV